MEPSSVTVGLRTAGPLILATVLAVIGSSWLLPRPRGRFVAGGVAALIAAAGVLGVWLHHRWGRPLQDGVGTLLFIMFTAAAVLGGATLVVQRNPARGAIAFAFAILGVCGLFLLLAAPFLMAATIIVYAGAIIVTFLFVLMLSRTAGPSDENDRSREPLLGSLAGFAFVGLVLWIEHLSAAAPDRAGSSSPTPLADMTTTGSTPAPAPSRAGGLAPATTNGPVGITHSPNDLTSEKGLMVVLTRQERQKLREALRRLEAATEILQGDLRLEREKRIEYFETIKDLLVQVVGAAREDELGDSSEGSLAERLVRRVHAPGQSPALYRNDRQMRQFWEQVQQLRVVNWRHFKQVEDQLLAESPSSEALKQTVVAWRNEVMLLAGAGELPARTVSSLGYLMYSEYLLAVELAGVLLLLATVGAVVVAQRPKGEAA
ncbi:MAG: NADH-quinone oxidoreductase subunit J [Gemmataceae bacterium]|nr:NADH-quinone oxidoreductase subunit J [Gemmataceae bacterium]MDW8243087.1 NADH-quinone oxidoreductase subunit J [Thermogemmata sp.]